MANKFSIQQWLQGIRNPSIRRKALANLESAPINPPSKLESSLAGAIMRGFDWMETPEKHDFWSKIHRKTKDAEITSIPKLERSRDNDSEEDLLLLS